VEEPEVIVDIFEPDGICKWLERRGIKVRREKLEIGDYVAGKVVIERKTIMDFKNALIEGRLWDQAEKLGSVGGVMVIIGLPYKQFEAPFWGAVASLSLKYRVPCIVLPMRRKAEVKAEKWVRFPIFFYMIERLILKAFRKGEKPVRPMWKKKVEMTHEEILEEVLLGIPLVSRKRARLLIEHFKDLHSLCHASLQEILKIKGFGEKIGKAVKEVF